MAFVWFGIPTLSRSGQDSGIYGAGGSEVRVNSFPKSSNWSFLLEPALDGRCEGEQKAGSSRNAPVE